MKTPKKTNQKGGRKPEQSAPDAPSDAMIMADHTELRYISTRWTEATTSQRFPFRFEALGWDGERYVKVAYLFSKQYQLWGIR